MADTKLTLTLAAKDLASREVGKLTGALNGVVNSKGGQSVMQGLGMGAGISAWNLLSTGISKVVAFAGDVIQAGIDEEASINKLTTALKANIKGWDGNTTAIEAVLAKRIDLGFSDDEQRTSLAGLVAATGNVTKALDIQRVAMDLARFKGISLTDATEALTKVEAGSYRILKSLGIQLPENATQTQALAAVQAIATGQAEAYANTTGGKLLVAQTKFGEKMDELGTKTLPIVTGAVGLLTGAMDGLSSLLSNSDSIYANNAKALTATGGAAAVAGAKYAAFTGLAASGAGTLDLRTGALNRTMTASHAAYLASAGGIDILSPKVDALATTVQSTATRMRRAFEGFTSYLLGRYNTNFSRAMGIQEARLALSTAKTDKERAIQYAKLAELGALSQTGYKNWATVVKRMAAKTTGAVHASYLAAATDIASLAAIAKKPITIKLTMSATKLKQLEKLMGLASGGPALPGHAYKVGENGPETLIMGDTGGRVIPNGTSVPTTSGMSVRIEGVSERQLVDMVDKALYIRLRRAGTGA